MQVRDIQDPRLVKALAHPLRVQILRVLETRVASPSEVADELSVKVTNISYHFRVLERVGMIKMVKTRQRRGAIEHYYKGRGRLRITDAVWAQVPDIVKNAMAEAAVAEAVETIAAAASSGGFSRGEALATRLNLVLDEPGFKELSVAANELFERATQIERESRKRIQADGDGGRTTAGFVMALFESAQASAEPQRHPHRARPRVKQT